MYNCVQHIRQSTWPEHWSYVPLRMNPVDHGPWSVPTAELTGTAWLTGWTFLIKPVSSEVKSKDETMNDLDSDAEIHSKVTSLTTQISEETLGSKRFEHFFNWSSLNKAVARLWWDMDYQLLTSPKQSMSSSSVCNMKDTQMSWNVLSLTTTYLKPILFISFNQSLTLKVCSIRQNLILSYHYPMPSLYIVANLLVCNHHESVKHQGSHFTDGAIHASGLWIVGRKLIYSSVTGKKSCKEKWNSIKCLICLWNICKLEPPFSFVGLNVFGMGHHTLYQGQPRQKKAGQFYSHACSRMPFILK